MELGARFWLGLIGIVVALGIGGFLAMSILGAAWYAWGAIGALVFVFLVIGALGYIVDRRKQKEYETA